MTDNLRDRIDTTWHSQWNETREVSDDIVCTYRWDSGDSTEPGHCQCQRWANHDGAHHCCCGATDE